MANNVDINVAEILISIFLQLFLVYTKGPVKLNINTIKTTNKSLKALDTN